MTRYRLYRLAMISAGLLGTIVMGAGISALGLHTALRVVAFCALAGAALSAGWHGVRYLALRHEEHLQDVRRHRAPRADLAAPRLPADPEFEPEPEHWQPPEAEAWPDPYAPDTDPAAQGARRYYLDDEIHVRRMSSHA